MSLLKAHIYCTEPFRVPLAGRITECLFDKTGTLTTDKLEALGALSANTVFPVLGKNGKEVFSLFLLFPFFPLILMTKNISGDAYSR